MAELSIKCEMCGASLEADTRTELMNVSQEHAKHAHDMDMSDQEAKRIIEGQIGSI